MYAPDLNPNIEINLPNNSKGSVPDRPIRLNLFLGMCRSSSMLRVVIGLKTPLLPRPGCCGPGCTLHYAHRHRHYPGYYHSHQTANPSLGILRHQGHGSRKKNARIASNVRIDVRPLVSETVKSTCNVT